MDAGAGRAARGSNLQDILRLLTLWFSHGTLPDVEAALQEGFNMVSIDTWLKVIPQVGSLCPTNMLCPAESALVCDDAAGLILRLHL